MILFRKHWSNQLVWFNYNFNRLIKSIKSNTLNYHEDANMEPTEASSYTSVQFWKARILQCGRKPLTAAPKWWNWKTTNHLNLNPSTKIPETPASWLASKTHSFLNSPNSTPLSPLPPATLHTSNVASNSFSVPSTPPRTPLTRWW